MEEGAGKLQQILQSRQNPDHQPDHKKPCAGSKSRRSGHMHARDKQKNRKTDGVNLGLTYLLVCKFEKMDDTSSPPNNTRRQPVVLWHLCKDEGTKDMPVSKTLLVPREARLGFLLRPLQSDLLTKGARSVESSFFLLLIELLII